jgi:hypothetical protein
VPDTPDAASVPNVLSRTASEFAALPELSTVLENPAYVVAKHSTLHQRWHSPLIGKFIQDSLKEIQAALVGSSFTPGAVFPGTETVQTTDATPTDIATISIADAVGAEVEALFYGKRVSGDWVRRRIRAGFERNAAGAGLRLIGTDEDSGSQFSPGTSLPTSVGAQYVADPGASLVRLQVIGAAGTTINWTCVYNVWRFT